MANVNYRHVASFTVKELRQLGWDGAMYNSQSVGTWVPSRDGYDSDPDDEYETFDRRKAHRSGAIGLPMDDINKVMYYAREKWFGSVEKVMNKYILYVITIHHLL